MLQYTKIQPYKIAVVSVSFLGGTVCRCVQLLELETRQMLDYLLNLFWKFLISYLKSSGLQPTRSFRSYWRHQRPWRRLIGL